MFEAARPICCSFLVKLTFAANLKAEGSRKSPPKRQCPNSREVIGVAVVNTAASDRLQAMDFDLLYSGAMFKPRRPGLRAEFQASPARLKSETPRLRIDPRSGPFGSQAYAPRSLSRKLEPPISARKLESRTRSSKIRSCTWPAGSWRARHFLSQPAA